MIFMRFLSILIGVCIATSQASASVETLELAQKILKEKSDISSTPIFIFNSKQVAILSCVKGDSTTANYLLEFKLYKSLKGYDYNIVDSVFYFHPNNVFLSQKSSYQEMEKSDCLDKKKSLGHLLGKGETKLKLFNNKMMRFL